MAIRYSTRGAGISDSASLRRCPVCEFPMHNGSQLVCEPGVCLYHERPIRYRDARHVRKAVEAFGF